MSGADARSAKQIGAAAEPGIQMFGQGRDQAFAGSALTEIWHDGHKAALSPPSPGGVPDRLQPGGIFAKVGRAGST